MERAIDNSNNDDDDYKEELHDNDNVDDRNKKIKFANFDFEQKTRKTNKQGNIHLLIIIILYILHINLVFMYWI